MLCLGASSDYAVAQSANLCGAVVKFSAVTAGAVVAEGKQTEWTFVFVVRTTAPLSGGQFVYTYVEQPAGKLVTKAVQAWVNQPSGTDFFVYDVVQILNDSTPTSPQVDTTSISCGT